METDVHHFVLQDRVAAVRVHAIPFKTTEVVNLAILAVSITVTVLPPLEVLRDFLLHAVEVVVVAVLVVVVEVVLRVEKVVVRVMHSVTTVFANLAIPVALVTVVPVALHVLALVTCAISLKALAIVLTVIPAVSFMTPMLILQLLQPKSQFQLQNLLLNKNFMPHNKMSLLHAPPLYINTNTTFIRHLLSKCPFISSQSIVRPSCLCKFGFCSL